MTTSLLEIYVKGIEDYKEIVLSEKSYKIHYAIPQSNQVLVYNADSKELYRVALESNDPGSAIVLVAGSSWVVLVNFNLFITGGWLSYELDLVAKKAYKREDLKNRRKYHGTILFGNRIYLFGGGTPIIEYFDDNRWNQAGQLTGDRQCVTCCMLNNLMYIASKNSNTIEEYNPSTMGPTRQIPADYAPSSKMICTIGNELYMFTDHSKIFKV